MKLYLKLFLAGLFLTSSCQVFAQSPQQMPAEVTDPLVEAQQKLLSAKGSYKTIRQQETAIEDMRKATKLSLKAAKLRAKAEKLQAKSDALVTKAHQVAISRGLYVTNPLTGGAPAGSSAMSQPPVLNSAMGPANNPTQTASAPSFVPVPGQAINIIVPKDQEVSNVPVNSF